MNLRKQLGNIKEFCNSHRKHPVGNNINFNFQMEIVKEKIKNTKSQFGYFIYIRCQDCMGEGKFKL